MEELVGLGLRISFMYVYAMAIVLLTGRRSIGAIAPIDLAVTVIVGDMFDDVFWAELSVAKGVVGMTAIVLLHTAASYASYKSDAVDRILGVKRETLVRDGRTVEEGPRRERLHKEDVLSLLRMGGVEDLAEVQEVSFEESGQVSIRLREEKRPAEKRDLPLLRRQT